jgi:hypothetical protein
MKKMTKQDFKNYIISEATKLYKIEVLKERKESIDKELKMLNEGQDWTNGEEAMAYHQKESENTKEVHYKDQIYFVDFNAEIKPNDKFWDFDIPGEIYTNRGPNSLSKQTWPRTAKIIGRKPEDWEKDVTVDPETGEVFNFPDNRLPKPRFY